MITLKTIVVATDFSETSSDAVDLGRSLADAFGSTLHLLHVVENPHLGPGGEEVWGFSLADLVKRLETAAETRMATLASDLGTTAAVERPPGWGSRLSRLSATRASMTRDWS